MTPPRVPVDEEVQRALEVLTDWKEKLDRAILSLKALQTFDAIGWSKGGKR